MNEFGRNGWLRLALLLCTATLTTVAASAANSGDSVPIYPHTHNSGAAREPINEKSMAQAIEQGNTVSIYTDDSAEAVDRWYSQMLPKTCARTANSDAHLYRHVCAARTVNILAYQSETMINIGPNVNP